MLIEGKSVCDIAREISTPFIYFDKKEIEKNVTELYKYFDKNRFKIFYASKSLALPEVLKTVHREGAGVDVCSMGEIILASKSGVPYQDMLFHGNNKSYDELETAIINEIGFIVADSIEELKTIDTIANKYNKIINVLLRVKVDIESNTHINIATAHLDQKFGLLNTSYKNGVREAALFCDYSPNINLVGLHSHMGSQILQETDFIKGAEALLNEFRIINSEISHDMNILDIGGGFGVRYTSQDSLLDLESIATSIEQLLSEYDGEISKIFIEPGRYISSSSCTTFYTVGNVKKIDGIRTYISTDGGISDNIRTILYDASYEAILANRKSSSKTTLSRVVGKHCDAGDIIIRDIALPEDITSGDLLAVPNTGAYCRALSNNYNLIPKPPIVTIIDGEIKYLQDRETAEDLVSKFIF